MKTAVEKSDAHDRFCSYCNFKVSPPVRCAEGQRLMAEAERETLVREATIKRSANTWGRAGRSRR